MRLRGRSGPTGGRAPHPTGPRNRRRRDASSRARSPESASRPSRSAGSCAIDRSRSSNSAPDISTTLFCRRRRRTRFLRAHPLARESASSSSARSRNCVAKSRGASQGMGMPRDLIHNNHGSFREVRNSRRSRWARATSAKKGGLLGETSRPSVPRTTSAHSCGNWTQPL